MIFQEKYLCLKENVFSKGRYQICPIRFEDRYDIMKWRNEQMYHLRQKDLLTSENQENYFKNVISKLFNIKNPNQILFSYLKDEECIGYGGLVHINWVDKNAEISFIMNTELEKDYFETHWNTYLSLIEEVAFGELKFHKIFTYAFDIRPHLYKVLENRSFIKEATLKEHCFFNNEFIDVIIHEKRNNILKLRKVGTKDIKLIYDWANDHTVRQNSINKDKIEWNSHVNWFEKKIIDANTKWFLLKKGDEPIGQIRYDYDTENDFWVIGFTLDEKYRGKGFGTYILSRSMGLLKNLNLKALVRKDNIASQKVFERLNFVKVDFDNDEFYKYLRKIDMND